MAVAALLAVATLAPAAESPRLGSMSTVTFCVRKAGPAKGAVRFVERKRYCDANELRVRVLGEGSTQAALGIVSSGGGTAPARTAPVAEPVGYVRVEGVSPVAAGTPEAATTTATCPSGYAVVGGGFRVDAGAPSATSNPAEVVVTESGAASASSWSVTAFADDAEDVGPWSVAARAICAG